VCLHDYPDDLGKTMLRLGKVRLEVCQPPGQ